jgi:hypothetical protein
MADDSSDLVTDRCRKALPVSHHLNCQCDVCEADWQEAREQIIRRYWDNAMNRLERKPMYEYELAGRDLRLGDQVSDNNNQLSWSRIVGLSFDYEDDFSVAEYVRLDFGNGHGGMLVRADVPIHVRSARAPEEMRMHIFEVVEVVEER